MSDNSNRVYSDAYAAKVLKRENLSAGKKTNLKKVRVRSKPLYAEPKPIDKHGNYDGTDVGFTSDSIQKPLPKKQKAKKYLNWEPQVKLDEGLKTTMEYFKEQLNLKNS